jgi:hypothetical protein
VSPLEVTLFSKISKSAILQSGSLQIAMRRLQTVAGIGVAITFLVLCALVPVSYIDEGFVASSALRVMAGEVPYRDFVSLYTPASFYLFGAIFELLGYHLYVLRGFDILLRLALVAGMYFLARTALGRGPSLLVAGVALLNLSNFMGGGYPVIPSLALSAGAFWTLLRAVDREESGPPWVFAGALLGLATAFRHDIGGYGSLAAGIAVVAWTQDPVVTVRRAAWMLGGWFAILAPMAAWLAFAGGLAQAWQMLFVIPTTVLRDTCKLPIPPLWPPSPSRSIWLTFYLPIFLSVATIAFLAADALRGRRATPFWRTASLAVPMCLLCYLQAWNRNDEAHRMPAYFFAALLLALCVERLSRLLPEAVSFPGAVTAFGVLIILLGVERYPAWQTRMDTIQRWSSCRPIDRVGCLLLKPGDWEAVQFVEQRTPPNDRIFVGNSQHQQVVGSNMLFYFLSGRLPASRHHEMFPRLTNRLPAQEEIIADLERNKVRIVVSYSGFDGWIEPNESSVPSGVDRLDRYLEAVYRPVATFGPYLIREHRDLQERSRGADE